MSVILDVQYEVEAGPDEDDIRGWVEAVLAAEKHAADVELTVRIVGVDEIADLNARYRHKIGPTNILSFPFEAPPGVEFNLLGDLVIAAPVVVSEAREQHKTEMAHWAHILVHGTLHLLGYDHQAPAEAEDMEAREIRILQNLGYSNPYLLDEAS
jgi:probable rRNA maturation factor